MIGCAFVAVPKRLLTPICCTLTCRELVLAVRKSLAQKRYEQNPCLSTCDVIADSAFILWD